MKHTEMIMVIEAHSEGKTIQYSEKDSCWNDTDIPIWNFEECDYRVKPEPVYKVTTLDTGREVFKYVSINALKDALSLSCSNDDAERRLYLKLEELL